MSYPSNNPGPTAPEIGFRFGLRSLLIFVTVVCVLCGLLIPAFRASGEANRRIQCRNNLRQIYLGLLNYHDMYNCFPPPIVADSLGRPLHSWRVLLMPFMSGYDFYFKYDFSQPWNSPKNMAVAAAHPWLGESFGCPADAKDGKKGETSYMMIVGSQTAANWGVAGPLSETTEKLRDFILVAEVADSGVFWTEPRDLNLDQMSFRVNDKDRPSISSHHVRGAMALFADGRVELFDESTSPEKLRGLLTGTASKQSN